MTLVGKILVVLITVFSVVFMGFAVTVFATHTNWQGEDNAQKGQPEKLKTERSPLDDLAKDLRKALNDQVERHKSERDAFTVQTKDQQKAYNDLLERYSQAQRDVVKFQAQAQIALNEAQTRREEVMKPDEGLRDQLKRARDQKEDAVKKQFETKQAHIELQGQHETAVARNKDLEQQVGELKAVLESRGLPIETKEKEKARIQNPPQVEGIVMESDPDGKFVRISLGSNHGLSKGNRLEVFRVKPDSKYVGRIELIEVDPDRSVGKILPQFRRATIQEGDLVASHITASR